MTTTLDRRTVDATFGLDAAASRIRELRREEALAQPRQRTPEQFEARRVSVEGPDGRPRTRITPPEGYGEAWSGGGFA